MDNVIWIVIWIELTHLARKESDPASLQDTCVEKTAVSLGFGNKQRTDTTWSREEAFGTVVRVERKIVQLFIILILCYA